MAMKCPICGGKTKAPDSVHTPNNEIYRRHNCPNCNHQFYTIEFEIEFDEKTQNEWNRYHRFFGAKCKQSN